MTTPDPTVTPTPATVAGSVSDPPAEPATVTTEPKEDPIAKLQADPNALATLLSQVQSLTAKLGEVSTERDSFKTKEEAARRAQQTKEEQLQVDLDKANASIERLHNIVRQKVVENAISNAKGFEWHSVKQVMAELNPEAFEVDIDIENATGTVTGIESEIKRIAQQCPWLVSKDKSKPATDGQQQPRRPSGTPVAPPQGEAAKLSKREALIKKYPVIVQGRV
jgi:vancomycin resistance protein YoaR